MIQDETGRDGFQAVGASHLGRTTEIDRAAAFASPFVARIGGIKEWNARKKAGEHVKDAWLAHWSAIAAEKVRQAERERLRERQRVEAELARVLRKVGLLEAPAQARTLTLDRARERRAARG